MALFGFLGCRFYSCHHLCTTLFINTATYVSYLRRQSYLLVSHLLTTWVLKLVERGKFCFPLHPSRRTAMLDIKYTFVLSLGQDYHVLCTVITSPAIYERFLV